MTTPTSSLSAGPPTPEGKALSRANAITHGLTAGKLLADILGDSRLEHHRQRLRSEWQPRTPTEEVLVDELARHAAALELAEKAEAAVLRRGAQSALTFAALDDGSADDEFDTILAAAITSDGLERLTRYRRAHEKGFQSTLARLRELQAGRAAPFHEAAISPEPLFHSEESCENYLLAFLLRRGCPRCGHDRGSWLSRRKRWECQGCGSQIGLRTGTVMEHSLLSLGSWFSAIRQLLVVDAAITPRELAVRLGMQRLATVRRMAQAIRSALGSPNRARLLAGLDEIYRRRGGT